MTCERLDAAFVTPEYEDSGLFKEDICTLDLAIMPVMRRNDRNDYIFDAMIDGKYRVPVFFAGRRASEAESVIKAISPDVGADGLLGGADLRPLPLQVEGAWRRQVQTDVDGFARATYQFIAAVWTIGLATADPRQFGASPVR